MVAITFTACRAILHREDLVRAPSVLRRRVQPPGHTQELAAALKEELSSQWRDFRGIEIQRVGVSSVKASEEDEQMIKELQRNAAFRDPSLAAAYMVGSTGAAMQAAAANEGAGAAMAFMGMNMAQGAGGVNAQSLYQMGAQQQAQVAQQPVGWMCACGASNSGKFCSWCGKAKPIESDGWTCVCGSMNKGKFCGECGAQGRFAHII